MQVDVAPSAGKSHPVFVAVLASVLFALFPVNSVFAYSHDLRDDLGQLDGLYFTTHSVGGTWVAQPNDYNGYDDDTAIDCLEQYDNCRSPGTSDTATWYPYPNPYPYWMCPYSHIASYSGWSGSYARYITSSNNGDSFAYSSIYQPYYLNAWYQVPNGRFYHLDYSRVEQNGGGNGSISADATDFHYNPRNPSDSGCT